MSNIIEGKYTSKELQQIYFYNRIKELNKLSQSFKSIKDRNIEKLKEYKFIDPIYAVKLKAINEPDFNKLVEEINCKIKKHNHSLSKLEKISDKVQIISICCRFVRNIRVISLFIIFFQAF